MNVEISAVKLRKSRESNTAPGKAGHNEDWQTPWDKLLTKKICLGPGQQSAYFRRQFTKTAFSTRREAGESVGV